MAEAAFIAIITIVECNYEPVSVAKCRRAKGSYEAATRPLIAATGFGPIIGTSALGQLLASGAVEGRSASCQIPTSLHPVYLNTVAADLSLFLAD
jgi:hypothetical protein